MDFEKKEIFPSPRPQTILNFDDVTLSATPELSPKSSKRVAGAFPPIFESDDLVTPDLGYGDTASADIGGDE